jgi:integrase
VVLEELPIRDLLAILLGPEGRRRMENQFKTNDQLFQEFYNSIALGHAPNSYAETRRVLEKYRSYIGQFPPTIENAIQFLNLYKERSLNTRARYTSYLSAFFKWFCGEPLPLKIPTPKILPQYVPGEEIDRLIATMRTRRTHRQVIERDVLLVETARHTGLRSGELARLEVGDLHLGANPVLIVRRGKGAKDRAVPLNTFIAPRLAGFVKGKSTLTPVFDLGTKTISMKIRYWAKRAGLPHLHAHSLRHHMATEMFNKHVNPRAVQEVMGHESLDTTMRYAQVTAEAIRQAVDTLVPVKEQPLAQEQVSSMPATQQAEQLNQGEEGSTDKGAPPQSAERIFTEHLKETPHELQMRRVAQSLAEAITVPSIWDKDLWRNLPVDFQPGEYFLTIGAVTISTDRQVTVKYYDPAAIVAETRLVQSLYSHLKTSGLPKFAGLVGDDGKLNHWKLKAGQYSRAILELLRSIVDELVAHRAKLNLQENEKPGYTRMFPITVWNDALQTAGGHPWINNSWYRPPEFNPATHLWQLKCGGYIIRIAKSLRTLHSSQNWHRKLRQQFTTHFLGKDLILMRQDLNVLADEIRDQFAEFSNTGHLPGHCELCYPA